LCSDLALVLMDLRNERGWTKQRLARELGGSPSTLNKLELGGQFRLWERTWQRIVPALARLLDVPADELQPLGRELIAEVVAPVGPSAETSDVLASISHDPDLDEEAKRFLAEAYLRVRRSSSRPVAVA
jgi:transcriptional regulator with XRE-family HTH domain